MTPDLPGPTRVSRVPRRAPVGTVVVALLAAAVTVAGGLSTRHASQVDASQVDASQVDASQVDVVGATAVCPDLRQVRHFGIISRVSVGAAPLSRVATAGVAPISGGGSLQAHPNGAPTTTQPLPVEAAGQVAVGLGTTLDRDALVVAARGPLSAGLEAEQVTRAETGRNRGLAGLRCDAPRTEAWFVGGGTSLLDETTLVLVNVDDTPATVDVSVFTSSGPADPRQGQGITIAPHGRVLVAMDTLAPDRRLLTVHVHSRRGRVAAGLRQSVLSGKVPLGVDWIPQSVPPATSVTVPGVPAIVDAGNRTLIVSNPGTDDTVVSVQLTTSDGQFVPAGLDQVSVPAGTSRGVSLDAPAKTSNFGVRVSSQGVPVLASVFVRDAQGGPVREFAYTSGSLPLSGPALLTDLVLNRPTESTLLLTAPDSDATVTVSPIRVLGTAGALPAAKTIRIPGGRTVALKLSTFYPPGTQIQLAVEVRPLSGSGPVYAARYLRERGAHGPLTTLLDLQGPLQTVTRPTVVQDPRIGR